eukprot:1292057-Prymnesium_polylepis.1
MRRTSWTGGVRPRGSSSADGEHDARARASSAELHGRFLRTKLRYNFTIEDVCLSCDSALLQATGSLPPTVALTWRSGRKVAGGI